MSNIKHKVRGAYHVQSYLASLDSARRMSELLDLLANLLDLFPPNATLEPLLEHTVVSGLVLLSAGVAMVALHRVLASELSKTVRVETDELVSSVDVGLEVAAHVAATVRRTVTVLKGTIEEATLFFDVLKVRRKGCEDAG